MEEDIKEIRYILSRTESHLGEMLMTFKTALEPRPAPVEDGLLPSDFHEGGTSGRIGWLRVEKALSIIKQSLARMNRMDGSINIEPVFQELIETLTKYQE